MFLKLRKEAIIKFSFPQVGSITTSGEMFLEANCNVTLFAKSELV